MGSRRGKHVATRPKSRRWIGAVGVLAAAAVVAGILFTLPSPFATAGPAPEAAPAVAPLARAWSDGPEKGAPTAPNTTTYGTVPSPLSMDDPYDGFVPVQCPQGTTAGAVDANGNQSDCRSTSTDTSTGTGTGTGTGTETAP